MKADAHRTIWKKCPVSKISVIAMMATPLRQRWMPSHPVSISAPIDSTPTVAAALYHQRGQRHAEANQHDCHCGIQANGRPFIRGDGATGRPTVDADF